MLLKEEMVDLEAQENKSMKQFDLIYAMGCSYIQGCELNGQIMGIHPEKYVENRFTEIISEKTNIPFFNDAVGGAGNDKIIRKTFDFVKMKQFKNASIEMLDSRWNKQTPNRAKHLSDLMATLEV